MRLLPPLLLSPLLLVSHLAWTAPGSSFTLPQVLDYPFVDGLASATSSDAVAWVRTIRGVRNVWMAHGPDFVPRQVTNYHDDDGQEISHLTFSPDGTHLVYVLGGDHDSNWPAEGNLDPDPDSSPVQPHTAIWAASLAGGAPVKIAEGDAPAISSSGTLAYIHADQVWTASWDGGHPEALFFDRGKDSQLQWSPDGTRLAFVSRRGDHSFVGVFASRETPIVYLSPSTSLDDSPRWSPDGKQIAFVRQPGTGGPPEPLLKEVVHPWSIWIASAAGDGGHPVWQGPDILAGSYPDVEGKANLNWGAGNRLVFLAYLDGWPHLYSVPATGGNPHLLTPGSFMVEHVSLSRDRRYVIYDANTGSTPGDDDRRHLYKVAVDSAAPVALTSGDSLEWSPRCVSDSMVVFVAASAQQPPQVARISINDPARETLASQSIPSDFPLKQLIVPRRVTFSAIDNVSVHGQLFETASKSGQQKPAVIFVHGGPARQMLLGWHYMDYYSNAYAVNQYLAAHGYVVLSVNYRLGIGYGRAFHHPEHASYRGASEYQDVLAAARFLQSLPEVDSKRIGIWGGSYGGFLTALALARNSDIFRSGVDLHGVHDWSRLLTVFTGTPPSRFEKGDFEEAIKVAFSSSPDTAIDSWRSPVLLIQGDDDRNVPFEETVDLARRLQTHHVPFEELVLPNEVHSFLRYASWLRADNATVDFLHRTLHSAARSTDSAADLTRDSMIKAGPYRLHVRVTPGNLPAIVLESGGGLDASEWADLQPKIHEQTGLAVVSYDRAGFGRSDLPRFPYDANAEMDALHSILAKLRLDSAVILVGHSYGALLNQLYAARAPGTVQGMVLLDPNTIRFMDQIGGMEGLEKAEGPPDFSGVPAKKRDAVQRQLQGYEATAAALRKAPIAADIPVYLLAAGTWSNDDKLHDVYVASQRALVAEAPNRKFLLAEGSGHLVAKDRPDLVLATIKSMVTMVKGNAGSAAMNARTAAPDGH